MRNLRTAPIVAISLAVLLLVGIATTAITLRTVSDLRSSILAAADAQERVKDHLMDLRSQIYVSSILLRDCLLDEPSKLPGYRASLAIAKTAALREIENLRMLELADKKGTLPLLIAEVNAYWKSVERVLDEAAMPGIQSRFAYVRQSVIPRRQAVVTLAEELADISAGETLARRRQLAESMGNFHNVTTVIRTGVVGLAALIAMFTVRRVVRLERASLAEHERLERAEHDLRDLSKQVLAAQEQERRFLSRELHDHVGQSITALRLAVSNLEAQNRAPTADFSRTVERCRLIVDETMASIRGLAMGLRPAILDDLGLGPAIEWQAREFSRRFDTPVTVTVDRDFGDVPEPQRTGLYRIAQEALTNCARHAKATSVRIHLQCDNGSLRLAIADDGIGMPATGSSRTGFGLVGMQERVRELGGLITFRSQAGAGTEVNVEIPLTGGVRNGGD